MNVKIYVLTAILSLFVSNVFSQDSVYVYDIASQTLTQKLLPEYNLNAVSDSTNPSFGIHGNSVMPSTLPVNTYTSSGISLLQKASDFYSSFNFPFTAVSLIRFGFNITAAVIGKRALLVFNYDVRQPNLYWRNLTDANPFYENGSIQYGFNKLIPVKYYTLNSPDSNALFVSVIEVAEDIGNYAGYFGVAFDTTALVYDSTMLYNISYPKKDMFNIYPDSTNGDTLCMKYGRVHTYSQYLFQAYRGGEGEYDSPYFDKDYRIRGLRWSEQFNYFIDRKSFYFLKYVVDSLANGIDEIENSISWSIYPNPATKNISIQFSRPVKSNSTIIISDILGQAIKSRELLSGEMKLDMDVSNLSNGLYTVTIINSDEVKNGKFIKN